MQNPALVEFLSKKLSYESPIRVHAKRVVEDARSVVRSFHRWRHREERPPTTLHVETTNVCNANCVFCAYQYQDGFRQGKGVMSDEIFSKAVHQYREMGGKAINFVPLVGDSLVDPKIIPRIQIAKDLKCYVEMFTNGILLNHIDLESLLKTGLNHITLSTGPFEESTYESVYRTKKKYPELIEGLVKLLTLRNSLQAPLRVSIAFRSQIPFHELNNLPDYRDKIWPLLTAWERKHVYAQIKSLDSWGGQIAQEDLPGIMEIAKAPLIKRRPCEWTFTAMVLWDGKVRACSCRFTGTEKKDGDDGLLIGDLRQNSLSEIWHGDETKKLRRRFPAGDLPVVCRKCTMYHSC
jgi:MoaA/NifB/PqqE/SkfB family radical SAM enzyme